MDGEIQSQAEAGEEILSFDVTDDALERAGSRGASHHLGTVHSSLVLARHQFRQLGDVRCDPSL
jgi:hypothetical protein